MSPAIKNVAIPSEASHIVVAIKPCNVDSPKSVAHFSQLRVSAMRVQVSQLHNQLHDAKVHHHFCLHLIDNMGEGFMEGHGAEDLIARDPPWWQNLSVFDCLVENDLVGPESSVDKAPTHHCCHIIDGVQVASHSLVEQI